MTTMTPPRTTKPDPGPCGIQHWMKRADGRWLRVPCPGDPQPFGVYVPLPEPPALAGLGDDERLTNRLLVALGCLMVVVGTVALIAIVVS